MKPSEAVEVKVIEVLWSNADNARINTLPSGWFCNTPMLKLLLKVANFCVLFMSIKYYLTCTL